MEVIIVALVRILLDAFDVTFSRHAIDGFLGQIASGTFNNELGNSLRMFTLKVLFPGKILLMKIALECLQRYVVSIANAL